MKIPTNIIFPWQGNHASIPAGWSRETTLDDKFAKAWGAENPNTTGGATTHTHTSPSHTHTLGSHTHTYDLTSAGITPWGMSTIASETPIDTHTHTGTSGALSGGTTEATAVTYGAASNNPPYYEVIFIKATNSDIPNNLIAYWNTATVPDDWFFCNGDNSTPDLRNKYLKGAGTGANAGGTGGSTTNSHDITHTHTTNTHTHVSAESGTNQGTNGGDSNNVAPSNPHTHSVTLDASTQNINSNTDTLITTETVEPAFKKLLPIQKKTGGKGTIGLIGLWLGDVADIPSGWKVCDGNNGTPDLQDKFIKCANTTGEIGDTGGANTHTHAAQAHSHTGNGTHTHTGSSSAHVNTGSHRSEASSSTHRVIANSTHPVANVQAVTANYDSANTTADSASNQPAYRTAAYIMLMNISQGASMMTLLL